MFCYVVVLSEVILYSVTCGHFTTFTTIYASFTSLYGSTTLSPLSYLLSRSYLSLICCVVLTQNGYTDVIDWWAYGVLIFELLTGRTPFCSHNSRDSPYEIFLRILKNKISFPRRFDPDAKSLVSALCNCYAESRLTGREEIKQHRFYSVPWTAVRERRVVPPFVPSLKEEGDSHYFADFDK